MSDNPLEDIIEELRQLRIDNEQLRRENKQMKQRLKEKQTSASTSGDAIIGDRAKIVKSACPGTNRDVIPGDCFGEVAEIKLPWAHIKTDSNLHVQRCAKNIKKISLSK